MSEPGKPLMLFASDMNALSESCKGELCGYSSSESAQ